MGHKIEKSLAGGSLAVQTQLARRGGPTLEDPYHGSRILHHRLPMLQVWITDNGSLILHTEHLKYFWIFNHCSILDSNYLTQNLSSWMSWIEGQAKWISGGRLKNLSLLLARTGVLL